ncbi:MULTISPECIES: hypothetical protein [unclassified Robiginitalea]|uniref:hypothetical protein n=2 Tax=Flavobacteriaceae TaxID=49546 RepID=UPI00300DC0C8
MDSTKDFMDSTIVFPDSERGNVVRPILTIIFTSVRYANGMILVFKHFFYRSYVGLSLWPFIILRNPALKADRVLINHERIHLRQQAELLVVFFYLWYAVEWTIRCICYLDTYRAYRNISFEREAYWHERDAEYLENRSAFRFVRYLFEPS